MDLNPLSHHNQSYHNILLKDLLNKSKKKTFLNLYRTLFSNYLEKMKNYLQVNLCTNNLNEILIRFRIIQIFEIDERSGFYFLIKNLKSSFNLRLLIILLRT